MHSTIPRDMQALVLTHPQSAGSEWEPYLSWKFRPLRPLAFLGSSVTSKARCKKEEGVYFAWKDLKRPCHMPFVDCHPSECLPGALPTFNPGFLHEALCRGSVDFECQAPHS